MDYLIPVGDKFMLKEQGKKSFNACLIMTPHSSLSRASTQTFERATGSFSVDQ